MYYIILGIAFLLIIAIVVVIFRILKLLKSVKEKGTEARPYDGKIHGVLFIIFFIVSMAVLGYYSIVNFDKYTIPLASEHGKEIDQMMTITFWAIGIAFLLTHVLLFYFSFKYSRKEKPAFFYPENNRIEILWTIIPAIVLSALVFTGWKAWRNITKKAPDNAEVVEIMGVQFAWKVRYPGKDGKLGNLNYQLIDEVNEFGLDLSDKASFDDFNAREIHVPKGKPVLLRIRSRDVIHSVSAPHFRLKMDAVPGMPTRFWFIPSKSTADMRAELKKPDFNYEIACTEVCGKGHYAMRMLIVVDEPDDYKKWYASQGSWLSKNPDYLKNVPGYLKNTAINTAGIVQKADSTNDLKSNVLEGVVKPQETNKQ